MRRKQMELLASSLLIGGVVGLIAFVFGQTLLKIGDIRAEYFRYLFIGLPIIGLAIVFLYQLFGTHAQGGMTLLFNIHQGKKKKIPLVLVPLIISTTWLTHLFGGSAGREGVAVQVGATIGTHVNHAFFKEKYEPVIFLMMGMAAGFGGLFQTPLTATVFSFEVFRTSRSYYRYAPYVALSSFFSSFLTRYLGLEKFRVSLHDIETHWNVFVMMKYLVLFTLIYFVGKLFVFLLQFLKKKWQIFSPYNRIFIGGTLMVILLSIFSMNRYAGLGTNLISAAFYGESIYWQDWLLKLVVTGLTLAVGFQGGEVTPLFAIGASFGVSMGVILGLPITLCAALGYVGVFTSASYTYFTGIALAYEVFGAQYIGLFIIMVILFRGIHLKRSIYPINDK